MELYLTNYETKITFIKIITLFYSLLVLVQIILYFFNKLTIIFKVKNYIMC